MRHPSEPSARDTICASLVSYFSTSGRYRPKGGVGVAVIVAVEVGVDVGVAVLVGVHVGVDVGV